MRFKRLKILRRKENDLNKILRTNVEDSVFDCKLFHLCSEFVDYIDFFTNGADEVICNLRWVTIREQFD